MQSFASQVFAYLPEQGSKVNVIVMKPNDFKCYHEKEGYYCFARGRVINSLGGEDVVAVPFSPISKAQHTEVVEFDDTLK